MSPQYVAARGPAVWVGEEWLFPKSVRSHPACHTFPALLAFLRCQRSKTQGYSKLPLPYIPTSGAYPPVMLELPNEKPGISVESGCCCDWSGFPAIIWKLWSVPQFALCA